MPRFFCPPPLPSGGSFELPPDVAHHAARVLRLRVGNPVELFDGQGNACRGVLTEVGGKRVVVAEICADTVHRESPLHTLLAQALCSSEKMDWVIQKATELGVTEIQPLDTERSVARLSADRAVKRMDHWKQVAISACEQCGRNLLPVIHAPVDIMAWLQTPEYAKAAKYILLPGAEATLNGQSPPADNILLLIGAEGGFTQNETIAARQSGFTPIRLGARVLRTETAALAGLTALQTLWGDFA